MSRAYLFYGCELSELTFSVPSFFFALCLAEWSPPKIRGDFGDIPDELADAFCNDDVEEGRKRARNRVSLLQIAFETLTGLVGHDENPSDSAQTRGHPLCCFREKGFLSVDVTRVAHYITKQADMYRNYDSLICSCSSSTPAKTCSYQAGGPTGAYAAARQRVFQAPATRAGHQAWSWNQRRRYASEVRASVSHSEE